MACEICGRSSCTRMFHSLSEQEEFDEQQNADTNREMDLPDNDDWGNK